MAKSGQSKGSTRTKFPVFNGIWNQNHVEWLVKKFGDHISEVKARDVRNKCPVKLLDAEYRKLLELTVTNGRAYGNGKSAKDNKYAIYFNSSNSSTDNENLFDKELLLHPGIIDLPSRFYRVYRVGVLDARSLECWVETKTYWTYLYQLICGFQKKGKVNLDILPNYLDLHTKRSLGLEARMYICIYKALKFGRDEMSRVFKSYGDNYNIVFLDILRKCSSNNLSAKLSGFKPSSPRYRYEYLQQANQEVKKQELKNRSQDSDISFLDREKQDELIRKFFTKELDWLGKQVAEHSYRFEEMCGVLKEMLATSSDPFLPQILSEWEAVEKEYVELYISQLRLLKDKPRLKKYTTKARKKYGFEV
jgi:hypothetical protein